MENETSSSLSIQNITTIKLAENMPDRLQQLVDTNKWEKVSVTNVGYAVHTLHDSSRKKRTTLITGTFQTSIDRVLRALVEDVEQLPEWNPQVLTCKIIDKLDSNTDIMYQITKGLKGFISPREFILLRRLKESTAGSSSEKISKSFVFAMESIALADYPETAEFVRGCSGLSGWLLSEGEDDVGETTKFQWVTDIDPKLSSWLPYKLVEKRVLSLLSQTVESLNTFLQ